MRREKTQLYLIKVNFCNALQNHLSNNITFFKMHTLKNNNKMKLKQFSFFFELWNWITKHFEKWELDIVSQTFQLIYRYLNIETVFNFWSFFYYNIHIVFWREVFFEKKNLILISDHFTIMIAFVNYLLWNLKNCIKLPGLLFLCSI